MSNDLGVSVTANTADLNANLALANASVREHAAELRRMASAAVSASEDMRASMLPALQSLASEEAKAREEVAKLKQEMKGGEEEQGLVATFDALKGRLTRITDMGGELREFGELLLGAFAVERIADFVDEITEAGAKIEHLSQEVGMPAAEISRLGFAAKAMGVDIDETGAMMARLAKASIEGAGGTSVYAKAFEDLGVNVRNADGSMKSSGEILNAIADAFARSADGPAKTALAMQLMGRAGAEMIPLLNQGSAGLKAMADQADATGSVISGPMAEGMERTSIETATMKAAFSGLENTLYEAFKPALDDLITGVTGATEALTHWFATTSAGNSVLAGIVLSIDTMIEAVETLTFIGKEAWNFWSEFFDNMGDGFAGMGAIAGDITHGNFAEVGKDWSRLMDHMKADTAGHTADMIGDLADFSARTRALVSNLRDNASVDVSGGKDGDAAKKAALDASNLEQGGGQKSQVQAWQQQLTAMLLASKTFGDAAKSQEMAFWQEKLAAIKGGGTEEVAERAEINSKLYSLESEANAKSVEAAKEAARKAAAAAREAARQAQEEAKKAAEEQVAIAHDNAATAIVIAKMTLAAKVQALDAEVSDHKITEAQKITLEEQYAKDKLALDLKSVDDEIDVNNMSVVQLNQALNEKRKLYAAFGLEIQQDDAQMAASLRKDQDEAAKHWEQSLQPVGKAFDSMFEGVLEHHETFVQAMNKLELSLFNSFIGDVEKRVVHWAASELAQTGATVAGQAARTSAAAGGAAAQHAMDEASILRDAKKAAAGAYAAVAEIPIVGPILAPVAAAVAFAGVEAFSAAGGMDQVPYDNAPFMLHKNETVLPAEIAQRYRDAAPGAGGGALHMNGDIHIHQQPGQDGRALWQTIKGHMANDLRNGWRPGLARS
jgi:hypothetical protein